MAGRRRGFRPFALSVALIAVDGALLMPAQAGDAVIPVPKVTIYPGDVIDESMLAERYLAGGLTPERGAIESSAGLIGKVARRTLLPGQPIQAIAIDNPRLVAVGARVKIVFSEAGMIITAFGVALQAGGIGDFVHVRNQDSGLTVTGRVQRDGSILVGEG